MGIFNKILGSILKGRTNTVAKMLGNDPELQRLANNVNKATAKLKESLKKAEKSSQRVSTRPNGGATQRFDDLQKEVK